MSDNLSADFSELSVLAADLGAAPKNVGPNVRKALEVTARKVKDSARDAIRGRRHWKQAARSIDYELKGFQGFGVSVLEAEIGYNKESSGNLGNLMEFGAPGSKNRLRPGRELQTSLQKNRDDFVKGLGIAVDDSLKAAKL